VRGMRLCSLLISAVAALSAQELPELQKKIAEFSLANGLRVIVLERHDSPVIAFHTWVNVGSVDDPAGRSGMAHMLEHMAYKGSETLGTRNWVDEKKAMDAIEDALNKAEAEARKGAKADQIRVDGLINQARVAAETAQRYSTSADYRRLLDDNGAVNPHAAAAATYTENSYSLPSNRAELWFAMEAQRLGHPVFREFYSERAALVEEYRQRVEGNPQRKMMTELLAAAFKVHPYRNPAVGWPGEIQTLRRPEAQEFFEKYYVPGNITMAMVGDITLAEARRLAEKYLGPMPAKPLPPRVKTQEPLQTGPKTVVVELPGPPIVMVGYKRPSQFDKDDVAFDVLQIILSQGRSSMLYSDLVQEKRVTQQAQATATSPDGRYPSLFLFMLQPEPSRTVEDTHTALEDLLDHFKTTPLDPKVIARAKATGRANLIRRMDNDSEMAALLALHAGSFGDWHRLFTQLDDLSKLGAEDLQRAASRYFVATGRTTLYSVQPGQSNAPPAKRPERKTGGLQ
jgi:predicted Zn-dependent peptidase